MLATTVIKIAGVRNSVFSVLKTQSTRLLIHSVGKLDDGKLIHVACTLTDMK